MMKNSRQFDEEDVLTLMMLDGFDPYEVIANANGYAVAITGNASPTAVNKVKRIARRLIKRAYKEAEVGEVKDTIELPEQLTPVKCQCGAPVCNTYGFEEGMFYQGCGFRKEVAEEIARRYNALPKVNDIIYAVGAPLGSDNYFKIRNLCVGKTP